MLAPLQAERQLLAIESALVPHVKPEDARKVLDRHTRILRPREARPKTLADALLGAGVQVVEVPQQKPSRKRRDETGRDKTRPRGEA